MRNTLTAALFYDHNSCSKAHRLQENGKQLMIKQEKQNLLLKIYEKGGKVYGKVVDILALPKKMYAKTVLKIK
jgi:hypothetical protein